MGALPRKIRSAWRAGSTSMGSPMATPSISVIRLGCARPVSSAGSLGERSYLVRDSLLQQRTSLRKLTTSAKRSLGQPKPFVRRLMSSSSLRTRERILPPGRSTPGGRADSAIRKPLSLHVRRRTLVASRASVHQSWTGGGPASRGTTPHEVASRC